MKKIITSMFLFIIFIIAGMQSTFAETNIKEKDILQLKLNIDSDTNNTENIADIGYIEGVIKYDENIFEEVYINDIKLSSGLSEITFNNNKFIIKYNYGVLENDYIIIDLKVKEDAVKSKEEILIQDIKIYNGENKILVDDIVYEVNIIENQSTLELDSDNIEIENEIILPENSGQQNVLMILGITCIVCGIIGILIALLINKKKRIIIVIISIIVIIIGIIILLINIGNIGNKNDINNDGKIDKQDVDILKDYLIKLEKDINIDISKLDDDENESEDDVNSSDNDVDGNTNNNLDVNGDGTVDLEDLGELEQNVEENELNNLSANFHLQKIYYEKDEKVILEIGITNNYGYKIEKLVLNGQNVEFTYNEYSNLYYIELEGYNESGIEEIVINEIKLSNGKTYRVNAKAQIEILKSEPTISDFNITEGSTENKKIVIFNFNNIDAATILTSKVSINKVEENVLVDHIKNGENKIEVEVNTNTEYTVELAYEFNIDTDTIDNDINNNISITSIYKFRVLEDGTIEISKNGEEFDYEIDTIKLKNTLTVDKEYNNIVEIAKNEEFYIAIDFEIVGNIRPTAVEINGEIISLVEKENGEIYNPSNNSITKTYYAKIKGQTTTGEIAFEIEKAIISDGTNIDLANQNIIEVIKEKPSVNDINSVIELDGKELNIGFNIQDLDNTLNTIKLVITDINDVPIEEIILDKSDTNKRISVQSYTEGSYKYKFEASYTLKEGNILENQILSSGEFNIVGIANVTSINIDKTHIEKQDSVTIELTIETNKEEEVIGFVIDDKIVDATKKSEGKYRCIVNFNETISGEKEVKISKVIFDDNEEILVDSKEIIEILKDDPMISDIDIDEDFTNETITLDFEIFDNEEALIESRIIVKDKNNIEIINENLLAGINNISIPIKVGEIYDVQITSKHKRDNLGTIVENTMLYTHKIVLVEQYNFVFNNLKITDLFGNDKIYFEQGEKYRIEFFSTNDSTYIPEKVNINNLEYDVLVSNEINKYYIEMTAENISGVKDIVISDIKLENNYIENINQTLKLEILKVRPLAEKLRYTKLENGDIRVYIDIVNDEAVINYYVTINDGNTEIYTNNNILKGTEYIEFTPTTSEEYNIIIGSVYDLDTNKLTLNENEYSEELINENVDIKKEYIEIKEIKSVILFKNVNGVTQQLDEVNVNELNDEDYFVQVTDFQNNTRYADVISFEEKNNELYLTLDIDNSVTITDSKHEGTIVKYGGINNGIALNINFEILIKMITEDQSANITLTQDLDANDINTSAATYINTFSGTLNANGYTISNLSKPLFNNLNGATVENLIIDDANIQGQAILSIQTENTTKISNVHIQNSTLNNGSSAGGFFATLNNNSNVIIEKSSISNTTIKGGKRTGGMIGIQRGEVFIQNSYIQGEVEGTYDAIGGVIGEIYGKTTIDKVYADIILQNTATNARGGFVGYGGYSDDSIKNSISLATGKDTNDGHKIFGNGYYTFSNVYSLTESTLINNNNSEITNISRESIDKDFILNSLGWDASIWAINDINSNGEMPRLIGIDKESTNKINEPINDVLIPNLNYVSNLSTYNSELEIAYHNMNVLMPYLDSETIILSGNKIGKDDILNKSKIKNIYPIDISGNLVVGLNNDTKSSISKIRIIFEDGSNLEYEVTYEKMLDAVAVYIISELDIKYNYTKLVFNNDNSVYNEILEEVVNMDYLSEISSVTPEIEDRLYVDYYNQYFVLKLEEKVGNIFEAMEEYTLTNDSVNISNKIKMDLLEEKRLEEIIYTANYFDRYYNFDIGISEDFSDIVFWESDIYSDSNIDAEYLIKQTLGTSEKNREKNQSISFYNDILKTHYENKEIKDFLEQQIKELALNNDADDWFRNQFGGILVERQMQAEELKDVRWTAWDHVNNRNHILLPMLSAPEEAQEDTYIISGPTQISIGSLNRYQLYLDGNIEEMENQINNYADMILNFYEVSASYQPNAEKWLNERTNIQYDTRFNFPEAAPNPGTQELGETEDPMYKWINDTIGMAMAANGSGAYANGTDVYWVSYSLLGTDFLFSVWTHETAHNQDGRYFYDGNWRRIGTGAEDHADYNIAQNMAEGHTTPNLRYDLPTTSGMTVNLKLDRIYGEENLHSFYDGMYDTLYLLDYLAGKAFLKLTPEEQSKLVTQVYYTNEAGEIYETANINTNISKFVEVTAEQIESMNLKTMQDLWDNRLVFKDTAIQGMNTYGGSTHYQILWYHPHNNEKVTDGATFKRTGYEMLAVAGIEGRIAYHSGKSENDLEALRIATGNSEITWEQYKMERWQEAENNLSTLEHFDAEIVIEMYTEAMKQDAKFGNREESNNLRNLLYNTIKHNTEDFDKGSTAYQQTYQKQISTVQELIEVVNNNEWGSYILSDNIDFSGIAVNMETNSYIANTFVGLLDGNGYEITGLDSAIFNKTVYGHFKNIVFDDIYIESDDIALISNEVENSLVDNIKVQNINAKLPIFGNEKGNNYEITETIYIINKIQINSAQDLIDIANTTDPLALKAEYVLADNIDLSTQTGSTPIISGTFSGIIDGGNYTITGLTKPIFENLSGTVKNLNIESANASVTNTTFGFIAQKSSEGALVENINVKNSTINAGSYNQIGTLFGYSEKTTIKDVKLENIAIIGKNEIGGLVGKAQDVILSRAEIINIDLTCNLYYGGGVVGRAHSSLIEDIYSEGKLTTTKTHSGGIVGASRDSTTIINIVSNMQIARPQNDDDRAENGGIVGGFETNNGNIQNAIQVQNVEKDVYKIISPSNSSYAKVNNVYEVSEKTGIEATGEINNVIVIEENNLTADFYENTLGLDPTIWDFSKISTLKYPTLK